MRQKVQRSLDDLDPSIREAARRAARRAGVPLADWINQAVAEQAGADPHPAGNPVGDRIDEIAERLESITRPARARPARPAADDLMHETSLKTASALDSVARWIEDADARWAGLSRESEERQERATLVFGRAFDLLTRRLDSIETRIAEGGEAPALKPVWTALQAIEGKIAALASQGNDVERLERTLSGFEGRLATIAERLAATPARRPIRRDDLGGALADIRARQAELDGSATASRPRPEAPVAPVRTPSPAESEALASLNAKLARIAERLDMPAPAPAADASLTREMARLREALEGVAPRSSVDALEGAVRDLGALLREGLLEDAPRQVSTAIERLHQDIRHVAVMLGDGGAAVTADIRQIVDRLDRIEPADTARIANEIAELRRFVGGGGDGDRIRLLADQMVDLNRQIARLSDMQVDGAAFAELKGAVEDIRTGLMAPAKGGRRTAGPLDLVDGLKGHIEAMEARLEAKIDALSATAQVPVQAPAQDPRLGDLLSQLVARLDTMDAQPAAGIDRLEGRIGEIAARLDRPRADDDLHRAVATLTDRIDEMRVSGGSDRGGEALERAIEALAARIDGLSAPASVSEEATRQIVGEVLKSTRQVPDGRIEQTFAAISGALEQVVTRLSALEREGAPASPRAAQALGTDIIPPEDDLPLEPGSGRPVPSARMAADTAAEPAPASPSPAGAPVHAAAPLPRRAAPAPAAPAPAIAPAAAEAGGANEARAIIAAARRAAQAAAAETAAKASGGRDASLTDRIRAAARVSRKAEADMPSAPAAHERIAVPSADGAAPSGSVLSRIGAAIGTRRRPILLAVGAIVLALGVAQILRSEFGGRSAPVAPVVTPSQPVPADPDVTNSVRPAPGGDVFSPQRQPEVQTTPLGRTLPSTGSDAFGKTQDRAGEPVAAVPAPAQAPVTAPAAQPPAAAPVQAAVPDKPIVVAGIKPADLPAALAKPGLRKAALAGDPVALYDVAARLAEGREIARDPKAAIRLLEKIAAEGFAPAQYRLANMFEKGAAGERDATLARAWYERAAERGNVRAMHNLAVLYAEGGPSSPDYGRAVSWFERAAQAGVRDSQYNLAILKARGLGTARDLPASYTWFAVAADAGDGDAASKRDEVAARLTPAELAAAKAAVAAFRPAPLDRLANEVVLPENGFEEPPARKVQKRA